MFSHQLIRLIEDRWQELANEVIRYIREHREMEHLGKLSQSELESWGRELIHNLGEWLDGSGTAIAEQYEKLGSIRFRESVPLAESVFALHVLKERIIAFARERGFHASAVEIYSEEELEHRLGLFFDHLVYHIVKGYEHALRDAAHLTTSRA